MCAECHRLAPLAKFYIGQFTAHITKNKEGPQLADVKKTLRLTLPVGFTHITEVVRKAFWGEERQGQPM